MGPHHVLNKHLLRVLVIRETLPQARERDKVTALDQGGVSNSLHLHGL